MLVGIMHPHNPRFCTPLIDELPPEKVLFGRSPAMQEFRRNLSQACLARLPVLMLGEVGVGKKTLSRFLHRHWFAPWGRYVKVTCASADWFWSPFTLQAVMKCSVPAKTRPEAADERVATLFLDGVDELPVRLQRLLASLLTEHGGDYNFHPRRGPICIVSSSTRNLRDETDEGRFRRDLFERLAVSTLFVPPLRDRMQDMPEICEYLRRQCRTSGLPDRKFPAHLLDSMLLYAWPGNLSELTTFVGHFVTLGPEHCGAPGSFQASPQAEATSYLMPVGAEYTGWKEMTLIG